MQELGEHPTVRLDDDVREVVLLRDPEERHQSGVVLAAEEATASDQEEPAVEELETGVGGLVLTSAAGVDEHDVRLVRRGVLQRPT
jgi:hypothetical protein